jgi:hypothetical protein
MITYLGDQISLLPLANPAAPTLTRFGVSGETTYTYKVVALKSTGHTAASPAQTVANGPATLSSAHYYDIKPPFVLGALGFDIYRIAGGTSQGKIGRVTPRNVNGVQTAFWRDIGRPAIPGEPPTDNTTGTFFLGGAQAGDIIVVGDGGVLMPVSPGDGGGALAIGDAIAEATPGSMLFVDADGELAQDNQALFWDQVNAALRLGPTLGSLAIPTQDALVVVTDDITMSGRTNDVVRLAAFDGDFFSLRFDVANGSSSAPAPVADSYVLGEMRFRGFDGSFLQSAVRLVASVAGTVAEGLVPGALSLYTTGSESEQERLRLTSAGTTGITSPDAGVAATQTVGTDGTAPSTNDTITVNGLAYTFKSALTPADYEVLIVGGDADATLLNFLHALNATGGTPGTDYQVPAAHPTVSADTTLTDNIATLSARTPGTPGNSLTLGKSGTHLVIGAGTFGGGRDGSIIVMAGQVEMQSLPGSDPGVQGVLYAAPTISVLQRSLGSAPGNVVTLTSPAGSDLTLITDVHSVGAFFLDGTAKTITFWGVPTHLRVSDNSMTALDVTGLTSLVTLECHQSQLATLDASGIPSLQVLYGFTNPLTTVDISGSTGLLSVNFHNTQLSESTVNGILAALVAGGLSNGTVHLDAGTSSAPSGQGATDKTTLQGRGWTVNTN